MNNRLHYRIARVNHSALFRAAAIAFVLMAGAFFLTACGGDESALPPADASSSAGSAAAGSAAAAAPANPAAAASADNAIAEPIGVVAGNAILADLAARVGGDLVSASSLVPPGSDVHTWQSTPQDSVRIAEASVVITNGANLSATVEDLISNTASPNAVRVIASHGLEPQELVELSFPDADHADEHGHGEPDHGDEGAAVELEGRLLIGDGETGFLSVIDLESGEVHQGEFDLGSRAGRIYASYSGRYAIAVSSDANNVHVLDGGIYKEEHGDHFDLVESDVSRLGFDLTGDRPVHMYVGEEWATIYYDGSGDFALINTRELERDGPSYTPVVLNAGPHHGAVIPMEGDRFAVTIRHPDYSSNPEEYRLPIGAEIWDLNGNALHRAEGCPDLHGDAGNGHVAVFGCTGGALAVAAHDGDYEHVFVPAPEGSPEDFRLTSLWGYHGLDHFFALGSAVGLYVVEPEAGEMEQLIPATEDRSPIQVALSYDGERLLVVMSDGELRMYEAHDLDLLASASGFLSAEIAPGFWARPHIATAPGHIFVTDSEAGEVIALDSHDLEMVGHWEVDGKPTKIAFVGLLDREEHPEPGHDDHGHEGETEADDDHGDDDHGHDHGAGDPHFWQNPRLVFDYVTAIADGLAAADPDNAATYLNNAVAYLAELEDLDAYIADTLAGIPQERRIIVTFHDAFGYFGARYDFQVMAFVGSHGGDVSPDDIANVLDLVEDRGLSAVFAEPQFSDDALEQVARDAGIQVGVIRSMPDEFKSGYIDMMRANADAIAELLR